MNDEELDELLNTWKTPRTPASLRDGMQIRIAQKQRKPLRKLFPWKLLAAATSVAVAVVLLANTSAFSRKPNRPPYIVDSEIVLYTDSLLPSGCGFCSLYPDYPAPKRVLMTSYNNAGSEVVLSWSAPSEQLVAAYWAARLKIARTIDRVARSIPLAPELESPDYYAVVYTAVEQSQWLGGRDNLLNSGCKLSGRQGQVIGQDVVLNYPTVVVRRDSGRSRTFLWMAPDLSCFSLRARVEWERDDGAWTLASEKTATNVTVNH